MGNAGKSVLILDDDLEQLSVCKTILEMTDYKVFVAKNGHEALALLSRIEEPDLILLDMQMADMSGPNFLVALEEKLPEVLKNVPIVFLTAMDNVPSVKRWGLFASPLISTNFCERSITLLTWGRTTNTIFTYPEEIAK